MKISKFNNKQVQTDSESKALALSVSMLLLLAIFVLSINFWNAFESGHDAIAINQTGRQRMLTQRIEKDLLKLRFAGHKLNDISLIQQDLFQSYQLFDQTLTKLGEGKFTDQNNNAFKVTSIQSEHITGLISKANSIWEPMRVALLPMVSQPLKFTDDNLEQALFVVIRDNLKLLEVMDSITIEIENAAYKKSEKIRVTEASAIVLILLNFGLVLFYFKRQLNLLTEKKLLSMSIIENADVAIVVINTYCDIELCNHAAELMFGYKTGSLAGVNIKALLEEPYYMEIGKRVNGEQFSLKINLNQINTSGRKLFITSLYDKTEQKLKEEQLIHLAYHDPLTELPNRLLFMDRLSQTLARAHRKNELAAILFIDLDRFKQVNDTMGHAVGDLLLQSVASRLKSCLREGDTLARLGGDEFTMIIEASDVDTCLMVTQRILSELNREFVINEHRIQISGSIGASLYPNNSNDIHLLLHYSDIAMYQAKAMGGNACCKYPENPAE